MTDRRALRPINAEGWHRPCDQSLLHPFRRRPAGRPPTGTINRRGYLRLKHKAFMVLGMHRSGTSAVAAVLHMCGATVGSGMLKASENNPKGYFESALVLEAMDQLLEACGSFWHDWRALDLSQAPPALTAALTKRLLQNFERNFGRRDKFTVKNPRNCRAVPFWRDLLAVFESRPVAIHVLRHPFEVADSLAKRDGMPIDKALLLWTRHVLDAERETRGMARCFVNFSDLLADWRPIAARIFEAAEEPPLEVSDEIAGRIAEFLDTSLRHERSGESGETPANALPCVARAWDVLSGYARDGRSGGDETVLDAALQEFEAACRPFQTYFGATEARLMRVERLVNRARDNLTLALNQGDA